MQLIYTSVDAVVERIPDLGKNALLAMLDIKQAYQMVPVHPQDWSLLGMEWEEYVYIDKALPFGLRSAPIVFMAVADGQQWIMRKNGNNDGNTCALQQYKSSREREPK